MKRSRFTEDQIIGVLKEHELGAKTADLCRRVGHRLLAPARVAGEDQRFDLRAREAADGAGEELVRPLAGRLGRGENPERAAA